MKEYGLVLEGGGAKGAYHVGAIKALVENGYTFNAVVGTSIGALNAALVAQGDFDKLAKIWHDVTYSTIFNVEEEKVEKTLNAKIDIDLIKYLSKKLGKTLKEGGIDTIKIRELLNENVDEEKLRKSDVKFGLVTYNLSDKQPEELFIEDIPEGKVIDYLMASSSLPVFKTMKIDSKVYLDGGIYDNCPLHMLEKKGYKDVFIIRVFKKLKIRNYKNIIERGNVNIHMIAPNENLAGLLNFDNDTLKYMIKLGYYDALKSLKELDGFKYYIESKEEEYFLNLLSKIEISELEDIIRDLKLNFVINTNIKKMFIDIVMPLLVSKTQIKKANSNKESVYALLEYVALKENIERFKIYEFEGFLDIVKQKVNYEGKNKIDEAIYKIIKLLDINN